MLWMVRYMECHRSNMSHSNSQTRLNRHREIATQIANKVGNSPRIIVPYWNDSRRFCDHLTNIWTIANGRETILDDFESNSQRLFKDLQWCLRLILWFKRVLKRIWNEFATIRITFRQHPKIKKLFPTILKIFHPISYDYETLVSRNFKFSNSNDFSNDIFQIVLYHRFESIQTNK